MQRATLHSLPSGEPWTVEEFITKTDEKCRIAALELNRRSLMVEEAVEEVLELVRQAAENFKNETGTDVDFGFQGTYRDICTI